MQSAIETIKGLWRCITITIASDIIKNAINKELLNIAKKVKIDGFRKGKIPINIVVQRYGISAINDVIKNLMEQNFINFINTNKIHLVAIDNYIPGEYKENLDFTYSVKFEIFPEIQINDFSNIKINKPLVTISNTDIDQIIFTLRKQYSKWIDTKKKAKIGDRVTIDFVGFINGKKIQDKKTFNFKMILGNNNMISAFNDGIINHNAGDNFIVNVKYPTDYKDKSLQGKDVNFNVILKKVEKEELPKLNKEFIENLNIKDGSINSLREEIHNSVIIELKVITRNYIKNQIIDYFLVHHKIDLPVTLMNLEIDILRKKIIQQNNFSDLTESSNKFIIEKAQRRVIIHLLLNKIIRIYDLKIDQSRVDSLIKEISMSYLKSNKVIKSFYQNNKLMNNVHNIVLEEQAIEIMLMKSKITEKVMNFQEIIKQTSN